MKKHLVLKQSVIAVALTLGTSHVALAQEAATAPAATVYITGSNLKRTEKEGTQPIQVITSKDIRDSGAATVTELMRKVPSMGSDINLDTNDGGFSRGASTASLRGLSSTSTLILLNGRRMTPAAYADPNNGNSTLYDLNAIPLSALERVEILKDGASAVYGSDAIGGVINFITKTNYQGTEVSARASANDDGKFARKGANFFFGKGDVESDGYNVFITADVSQRDRVLRKDVKDI
ncbi:TonB-dependent receptor plug domain-containing protein [Massilia frigida]|uniref:TonB-dependent receptor plug domain-containing protein n=1 Tax=Massilia frigida TaxID=2609281 RepID=UPI0014218D5F|nr:TonB-dependent receptor plug domain-containing protein [Massilia frigida]